MMDNSTMAEESCSLHSFRIRCPRSRKRAVRAHKEKQLIKLEKERRELWYIQCHKVEYVPLDPPIQRGFRRSFILREDVARSSCAAFYQGILDKINTVLVHHDRAFTKKLRKKGKKKIPIPQFLKEFDNASFRQLKLPGKEAALFYLGIASNPRHRHHGEVWKFREPWRFRLQIRRNLITQQKVENIAIDKREKEIDRLMDDPGICGKIDNLKGRPYNRYKPPLPCRNRNTTLQWLQMVETENNP